jgi:hypothetical protein
MQQTSNSSAQSGDTVAPAGPRARLLESLVSHLAVLAVVAASIAAVFMRSPAPAAPVAVAPTGAHAAPHQG